MGAERLELDSFDYALPAERIAQQPTPERDGARLGVLRRDRPETALIDAAIRDLPDWLSPGDLLVVNATRVVPARLRGAKASGGAAEALLLGADGERDACYRALIRSSGKLRVGLKFRFGPPADALDSEIVELLEDGAVALRFAPGSDPYRVGEPPLPPYIQRPEPAPDDRDRYQTVFARVPGAVAAPTAGLHLSPRLLAALETRGVERAEVVLHVGPGTFRPVRSRDVARGHLHAEHPEPYDVPEACAEAVARARARGGRVVAVGTTTTRALETCALPGRRVRAGTGRTDLFLRPGCHFRVVDALLTNFHLPRSSLLMLVAAFAGRERVLSAYARAAERGYRFYSYGDAMLVL
ncbi:MAG: tRNA preQ1(34) S-adenosylmethionine ribosyltransferase-isomerase QueA [Proteobacteria bacterium]|nr:tRNA preQ1(34) S-adenosylmethionine ribosyltransferase-isomerase QueA [Pseudomonadota bacterium]